MSKNMTESTNRTLRRELAAAYRLSGMFGWTDMVFNHISVRLPGVDGRPDTYLINPEGHLSEEITPACLLEVDVEGRVIDQPDQTFIPAGFVIHSAIHTSRKNAACIMHNHSMAGMVVSALKQELLPLTQISMEFFRRVAYHDFGGIELEMSASDKIVIDLGELNSMIMRNHGLLTVGKSIPEAFYYMHYLHQACEIHINTMKVTNDPLIPSDAICEHTAKQYGPFHEKDVQMVWNAMLRKLDREMPGWDN
ncbi:MAG: class II aldolase/adducin family protein [Planctomycetota bacterium]